MFILRHDRDKVNRLRTYLSWKDVRKTAKESGEGGGDDVDIGDDVEKPGVELNLCYSQGCLYPHHSLQMRPSRGK